MWVQTFGPATPDIQKAVKEANTMLPNSPAWSDNKSAIGVVNRRPRNLGDMILKRKSLALNTSSESVGTIRCTPFPAPGIKRKVGRPCDSCGLMSGNNTVSSTTNGKIFKTPSADCKSRNIVFCATCMYCCKQYVGKSCNRMHSRINGHRSHVGDLVFDEHDDEATLAEHLKLAHNLDTVELFNLSYAFTVLQLSPSSLDDCEQKWVSRLTTLSPFGLNKEIPRGVTDSVRTMCRKSLGGSTQRI